MAQAKQFVFWQPDSSVDGGHLEFLSEQDSNIPSLGADNVWTGNETHSATETFSGAVNLKILGNAVYADQFAGMDLGAQINAAYAALPSFGGKIFIPQKSDGSTYDFSTPIVFATIGKYVVLEGLGVSANTTGDARGQITLNYVPTTATSAITLDWTPAAGGNFTPGAGLRNFTLINNNGSTPGGTGSSAIGLDIGPSHGGAAAATFENLKIQGFGKGFYAHDADVVDWGMRMFNCVFAFNNVGVQYDVPHEQDSYFGCVFIENGVGMYLNAYGTEVALFGGNVDSNTIHGIQLADGAILHTNAVHWENYGGTPVSYVYSTASGSVADIFGGIAYDDVTIGSQSTVWFSAGFLTVRGLNLWTFGRATSVNLFSPYTRGFIDVLVNDPIHLPSIVDTSSGAAGQIITSNPTISAFFPNLGGSIINASTGFQIGGAAVTAGHVLRANGTNYVDAALAATDLSNGTSGNGAVALVGGPTFTGEISNSNGNYGSSASAIINSSIPVAIGAVINTGLFTLRDSTNSGSALVWYGDGIFSIIAQGGGTTFVTTAPGAAEIQIGYAGSPTYKLTLLAGSSRNGDTVAWSLVYNHG